MCTRFFKFWFILSFIYLNVVNSLPIMNSLQTPFTSNYKRAMIMYRKLEPYLSQQELQAITVLGIVNGAKEVEKQMEKYLVIKLIDFLSNTNMSDKETVSSRIETIEQQLQRDRKALEILVISMDLAMKKKHIKTYKKELYDMLRLVKRENQTLSENIEISDKIRNLRKNILKQLDMIKSLVDTKVNCTVAYLIKNASKNDLIATASKKQIKKRNVDSEEQARVKIIQAMSSEDDVRKNLIDISDDSKTNYKENYKKAEIGFAAVNDNHQMNANSNIKTSRSSKENANPNDPIKLVTVHTNNTNVNNVTNAMLSKQEDADSGELNDDFDASEGEGGAGGGGIAGLISSLSGGENGSDIGALIGALTGVISNLFGPGGLDIESLISTATALISGLLAGNKNFGTVLGEYIGTAFDGFSGGGGADPEEDDVPPRPLLFLKNVISSFVEAKMRKEDDEDDSEERKDARKEHNREQQSNSSSDSAMFIKHIFIHLVSGIVGIILNGSVGASAGASQASQSIFTGLSGHKPTASNDNGW